MKTQWRERLKVLAVASFSWMLMANQSCDSANKSRVLRKRVDVGAIDARSFSLPGGQPIDFKYVMNTQLPYVLAKDPNFIIRDNSAGRVSKLSVGDFSLLQGAVSQGYRLLSTMAAPTAPICVQDYAMAQIDGAVLGFEFASGIGISFGYSKTISDLNSGVGVNAKVDIKTAQLDAAMSARHPLTGATLVAATASSKQTSTTINTSIDFSGFNVGPTFWFQTPLAKTTESALSQLLSQINTGMKDPWFTFVHDVAVKGTAQLVYINGGSEIGLKAGDEFQIYNLQHKWAGAACNSKYLGNIPVFAGSIVLTNVGDGLSVGLLTPTDKVVEIGAKVVFSKFAQ